MPDLPLISLSQAHYDRVVAAFPGETPAEKAQAYRDWTINRLIDQVGYVEGHRAVEAVKASLPPRPTEPVFT